MIEMVIPSSLDPTVAPPGKHVVLLFTQYTPYTLAGGHTWDDDTRNKYADTGWDDVVFLIFYAVCIRLELSVHLLCMLFVCLIS